MKKEIKNKKQEIKALVHTVNDYYKKQGRHDLPWRNLPRGEQGLMDPYLVLVSEVMLQQTQVHRVIPYYGAFIKKYPTVTSLAKAKLINVLQLWSGLGYNRRGKFLWEAAKTIQKKYADVFPREYADLRTLPGVGDYTAKAVRVFAYNESEELIETNVRTVFFHHFFKEPTSTKLSDRSILRLLEEAAEGQDPRAWHAALMDYGAHLKQSGIRVNKKSAHYIKQKKFEGSSRQVRGAILKASLKGGSLHEVQKRYPEKFAEALTSLKKENLVK